MDMLPDSEQSMNLLIAVHILATAIGYIVKMGYGIKASITGKASKFDMQEKKLWQAVKSVKYESKSQKWRWQSKSTITPESFKQKTWEGSNTPLSDSSSSDDEEGAKAKKWKKAKKSK